MGGWEWPNIDSPDEESEAEGRTGWRGKGCSHRLLLSRKASKELSSIYSDSLAYMNTQLWLISSHPSCCLVVVCTHTSPNTSQQFLLYRWHLLHEEPASSLPLAVVSMKKDRYSYTIVHTVSLLCKFWVTVLSVTKFFSILYFVSQKAGKKIAVDSFCHTYLLFLQPGGNQAA